MVERKKKKGLFDEIFEDFFREFEAMEGLGGYSISVISSGGKTKVHVKADKNTDVRKLREELERMYPGAEITIEGGRIEEIGPQEEKPRRKSLIEVIDEKKLSEEEK